MKSKLYKVFFSIAILLFATNLYAQAPTSAWINEFHYDDAGADTMEFIEVLVNDGFTDLVNFTVTLYNGNGGAVYDTKTLDQFTQGTTQFGFTLYSYDYTANGGSIQNGSPDGLAIDYNGSLIPGQFLSYEGTFTAVGGPADGMMSVDIGVVEDGTTIEGSSVGLTGTGTQYSDFTWTNFSGTATPGMPNVTQTLPVELTSFTASVINNKIVLNWQTNSEVNNYGFDVERSTISNNNWKKIGFIEGSGTTTEQHSYSYTDNEILSGKIFYRLKQTDNDGSYKFSSIVEVDAGEFPGEFVLNQNYPNPFNPTTKISFIVKNSQSVELKVYNTLGNQVATLFDDKAEANKVYEVEFKAKEFSSGIYFYTLKAVPEGKKGFVYTRKMVLLK